MNLAGVYISEDDVMALVKEVDASGDGIIDFTEFRNTVLGFWLVVRGQVTRMMDSDWLLFFYLNK